MRDKGKVWLVGAGPGDAGLLTVKGERLLESAEVVLYDKLVGRGIVAKIPRNAEAIFVGKKAGNHAVPQEAINGILTERALAGKRVVRLKGGDPFLFGRGGEELEGLARTGIPFEVVPGVSSPLAVPAYSGIPLTHRDCASQVHIVAAHGKAGAPSIDWEALVRAGGTLVFLMGSSALDGIASSLLAAGMSAQTSAAVIERGTTARQRKALSTLKNVAQEAGRVGISPPALIVVGEVCAYAERFAWFEKQPLSGVRIAVTRPKERAGALSAALSEAGAEVVEIPVIALRSRAAAPELDAFFDQIEGFSRARAESTSSSQWLAFTSSAGVEFFFARMRARALDVRSLIGVRFAAIGRATAAALEVRGILVDAMPDHFSASELGRVLARVVGPGERVLLPRAGACGAELGEALDAAGIAWVDAPLYDAVAVDWGDAALRDLLVEDLDAIAFTSGSTVENFARLFGVEHMRGRHALCIGEATARAAAAYGMDALVAANATVEALVDAALSLREGG
ncbi:MAG: uroporphyrinogen-III C-methyltransferase [Spirochaetaceae bacterium]|jgi:uroporphyrinogen III methyltransferase/synthase|nr:uroporphyrinogen-III C-methyltransferase [Spirochaetaceae bacterium]